MSNLRTFLSSNLSVKFIKYLFVGGSAALINWTVFFIFAKMLLWHYLVAGLVAFVVATLWNFILARKFIFKASKHTLLRESVLIYLVSFVGLLLDVGILFICVEFMRLDSMLGKIIATGLAFVFNFSIRNFVIYKENL